MTAHDPLGQRFEADRDRLRAVAYRMLGSASEAEDAVQEAWLRLARSDAEMVGNLSGWLTTVVSRVCLDMLRSRRSRREEPIVPATPEPANDAVGAETEMVLAESVGLALLVVLQTLAPAERVAFVLHDMFDLSFDEIAPIVGRSPTATRQLASRGRRRVRGAAAPPAPELASKRRIVEAFLAASRSGDLVGLLQVLDPEVVARADPFAMRLGAAAEIQGADAVAHAFVGRAQAARTVLVDGALGFVVAPQGRLLLAIGVTVRDGRIVELSAVADPERLAALSLSVLGD